MAKQAAKPEAIPQSVPVFFHAEEIAFLMNALRTMPLNGTADAMERVLPVVQGVRLKIAQAGVELGMIQQQRIVAEEQPVKNTAKAKPAAE